MNEYHPKPIDTSQVELTPELVLLLERLAENTHDVWAQGRLDDGWTYGEVRDDAKKTHPCLVPYSELPEDEKEYDRHTSEQAIKAAIALGFQILPASQA